MSLLERIAAPPEAYAARHLNQLQATVNTEVRDHCLDVDVAREVTRIVARSRMILRRVDALGARRAGAIILVDMTAKRLAASLAIYLRLDKAYAEGTYSRTTTRTPREDLLAELAAAAGGLKTLDLHAQAKDAESLASERDAIHALHPVTTEGRDMDATLDALTPSVRAVVPRLWLVTGMAVVVVATATGVVATGGTDTRPARPVSAVAPTDSASPTTPATILIEDAVRAARSDWDAQRAAEDASTPPPVVTATASTAAPTTRGFLRRLADALAGRTSTDPTQPPTDPTP